MYIVSIRVNLRDLRISQKKLEDQASAGADVRISAQRGDTTRRNAPVTARSAGCLAKQARRRD